MAKQITEKQLDKIIDGLIKKMNKANELFLTQIGESIKQIRDIKPSQAHKLIQILKYGGNYEEIIKEISNVSKLNIKKLDEIFSAYSEKDQLFNKEFYEYRNIPFVEYSKNTALKKQTEAIRNIAKNEMYDYTKQKVLGYTVRDNKNNIIFQGLKETYMNLLDEAFINVGQGKETFDSAMAKMLKDIGQSGLKTINYESGRAVRLDSVIRMHLKNRINELHNENQKLFGEEFDSDGVEISVHENPAPDHEEAQGRQFSNEEFDKLQKTGIAKDYKEKEIDLHMELKNGDSSSSYRPISEMNCYHTIFSIILGVSEPEYSDKELKKIIKNNEKGFMLDGKHYTMYEGTQMQRELERMIREQKDIQLLAKTSDNNILAGEAQNRITILTNRYKELSNVSGLGIKNRRLRVGEYKREAKFTKSYNQYIDNMKIGKFDISDYTDEIQATTTDVILTPDRREHIHKDTIPYIDKIPNILENPDHVYLQTNRRSTVWLTKNIDDTNIKMSIRINNKSDIKQMGFKNSIIQMQILPQNRINKKLEKNEIKELIYKKKK